MSDAQRREAAPVREFADRGIIWLLGRAAHLGDLLAIIDPELADRFDWSLAVRINRSLVAPDLLKQEADLIFRAPYRDHSGHAIVYLLLEHQSRPDPDMAYRMLGYMRDLWTEGDRARKSQAGRRAPRPPIVPIILYTGRRQWNLPRTLVALPDAPEGLSRFGPRFDVAVLNLRERQPETLQGSAVAASLRVLREV